MSRLSVIIICRDEVQQIKACLESISWADEIIVVDSGSTDGTREIAEGFTPHVHEVEWKGFGPQKNHALSLATGDWVFSIDADERAERGMEQEVRRLMLQSDHVGYEVPRCNWFCGRKIRFGDWGGDQVLRLFQREHGRFTDDAVHERIVVDGSIGKLRTPLEHHTIRTLEQHRDKMRYYTELTTRLAQEKGRNASLFSAAAHGIWAFLRGYVFKGGFLDGRCGWQVAMGQAKSVWWRYAAIARGTSPEQAMPS
ncbi:MAG: LPS biosynthesis protein [Phycisphaerae bacterium]|nr:LPS biosynthesis protein [Phycisphaerae bacterium]|tara:strand:- start:672 stop:1433 length:762 start_codon:yes stop_codon:yes gene_type:complete